MSHPSTQQIVAAPRAAGPLPAEIRIGKQVDLPEALRQFEKFLETKDMRLTRQRRLVLERIYNLARHVSADDLAFILRREKTGISKATVYRTLALLEDSGLVEGNDFRRGYRIFEFAYRESRHDHILCVDGETVIEFQSPEISRLIEETARGHGFEPLSHTLTIFALCSGCHTERQSGLPLGSTHTHAAPGEARADAGQRAPVAEKTRRASSGKPSRK